MEEAEKAKLTNMPITEKIKKVLGKVSDSIMRCCFLSSQTLFESTMKLIKIDLFPNCHSMVFRPCNKLPSANHSRVLVSQAFP